MWGKGSARHQHTKLHLLAVPACPTARLSPQVSVPAVFSVLHPSLLCYLLLHPHLSPATWQKHTRRPDPAVPPPPPGQELLPLGDGEIETQLSTSGCCTRGAPSSRSCSQHGVTAQPAGRASSTGPGSLRGRLAAGRQRGGCRCLCARLRFVMEILQVSNAWAGNATANETSAAPPITAGSPE